MIKLLIFICLSLSILAENKVHVSNKGELIYENTFSGNDFKAPFKRPKKGEWTFPGTFMDYKEKPSDNHPGVLKYDKLAGDFIVEVDICFPKDERGGKFMAGFVINTKGHLGRINVDNRGFSTRKDKSDQKSSVKWKKGLEMDKWYTLTFECVNDSFVGQFNGKTVVVSHKEIKNSPEKAICITGRNKAQFRNFKVYRATARKDFKTVISKLKK